MRNILSVLLLGTALAPLAAHAQEAPEPEKLRVIVLDLKGGGLEPAQLEALTGAITVALDGYAPFDVLSSADVRAMVELEGEKQAIGCESDTSCLAEIAGAMGARLVVFGQMAKLGARYVLNLNLFDSEAGKAVGRSSLAADALDSVFEQIPAGVHKLVDGFLRSHGFAIDAPAPSTVVAAPAKPAPAASDVPAEPVVEEPGNPFAVVLPLGVLTFGAGLVAGGVVLDVLLPTSRDKKLEGIDFVSTGMYGTAAAVGIVGLVLFFANPLE